MDRAAARAAGGIMRRLARSRRGVVAIEFALGFPIFLALVYGLFEFGRIFWTQNTLEYAIQQAARFAMVNTSASDSQIQTVVTNSAVGLNPADISIDVDFEDAAGERAFINITGTYAYAPFVPLVVPFAGGDAFDFKKPTFDIVTSTRMAVVQ